MLTYPHCDLDKNIVLEQLWQTVEEYRPTYMMVCNEKHADGDDHKHVFLHTEVQIQIKKKDIRMFDLAKTDEDGAVKVFHCNIKACKAPKEAIEYVKKHGDVVSKGTCPFNVRLSTQEKNQLLQGKKLYELVDNGEVSIFKIPQLARAISILQYERLENEQRPECEIFWFWGKSGIGKSTRANQEAEAYLEGSGEEPWRPSLTGDWYDGYRGQRAVIIDDVRSDNWKFPTILKITDRWKLQLPVKGTFTWWKPERIWFTAPGRPEDVYRNHSTGRTWDGIEQLIRRIRPEHIIHFTEQGEFARGDPNDTEAQELEGEDKEREEEEDLDDKLVWK